MKKLFLYALFIVAIILAVSVAGPYWDNYWIGKEIEASAVYGTKNTIQDTNRFLSERLKQAGYQVREEDFQIEKDEKSRVTITFKYQDAVSVFGKKLKDLPFTISKTVSEVKDVV